MICPQCNTKTFNRSVSTACPKCRYQLVFPPGDTSLINDYFFDKKLKSISSNGTYYFTLKQLYYYILKSKARKIVGFFMVPAVICMLMGFISFFILVPAAIILIVISIILVIIGYKLYSSWKLPYDFNKFNEIVVKKWQLYKGDINKLIKNEDLKFNLSKFDDIQNYSFDALIITGDNEIANFLIKNDFHFKNKAAIVSIQKYPNHLFPYVIEQIEKNPDIPIFLVHNADILNIDMKEKIQKNWFKNIDVKIFDLGLHPSHVLKAQKIVSIKRDNLTLPDLNLNHLPPSEQTWLKSGYYTELSVVAPVKLINILEYAVNIYKEKGQLEFEKIMPSLFMVGLGLKLPSLSNKDGGFEVDFGGDFG